MAHHHPQVLAILWLICLSVISFSTPITATSAEPVDPLNPEAAYGSQVVYGIYRNNKKIGTHTVSFKRQPNDLLVEVSSKLVVSVLKIPVYRFNYSASERWQNGVLQEITATVTEKGETKRVALQRQGDKTLLTEPSGKTTLTSLDFGSNHWHPGVLQTPAIFNTLTGKANKITITNKGSEQVTLGQQSVDATHYHYSGELQTDVWYDARQRWVKLRFEGRDGSTIEYRCEGFNV